ncbi:MAG: hypothetical protein H0V12_03845 [Chloroflexi bacterium]|nr:hypothetical protein [Chloroflexota bacterium]
MHRSLLRILALLPLLAPLAAAQTHAPERLVVPYPTDTGVLHATEPGVLAAFQVEVRDASWLRLHFEVLELGGAPLDPERGIVRITSFVDGAEQHLDALSAGQWQGTSAYFNGDSVWVELLAGPAAGGVRVALRSVEAGVLPMHQVSLCDGTDERVPSNDPRVARLMPIGCTGWIFDDCYRMFLTAGHCTTASMQVAQFNVPPSNGNGAVNHPPPSQQYAVDTSSIQSTSGGVGNDWGYFGAFPNTETGLTPWQAQGAFHILGTPPVTGGTNLSLTGYGTASGVENQVQQIDDGPLVELSGTTLRHRVDTTGGNSGSPVLHATNGQAVAIHTHAGCSSTGGANSSTSVLHAAFNNALASPQGICDMPVLLLQPPPAEVDPGVSVDIVGRMIADPIPGSAFLRYRADGGAYQSIPLLDLGGGLVQATLPAAACGDAPQWYLELVDTVCGLRTLPAGAPAQPYSLQVGELVAVLEDSMEQDLGWSTEVLQGATAGHWQRGVPVNDPNWAYDPASDADGSGRCWLTQNALGNTDVDNGAVRLTSYAIALPQKAAAIRYSYFLRMTGTGGTDRLLVEARVEPAGAWTQIALHDSDGGLAWRDHEVGATALAQAAIPQGAVIRLRFTANDSNPQTIVEAGVDALRVLVSDCGEGVGTSVCVSGANGAVISGTGSASVAANDLVLAASGLPTFVNAIFFYGDGLQQTPFGKGFLCLSGSSGLFRLLPVQSSGAAGSISLAVDLTNPPVPAATVLPGSTWNFQAWFRDGATFDLSDALSIDFVP